MLSEKDKNTLLYIARKSVEATVKQQPLPEFDVDEAALHRQQGAFVTLKKDGHLRGCLGRFVSDQPLWETVRDMGTAAAAEDPRFISNRLSPDELDDLEIEISVLSELVKSDEPLEDIEIGKHGIYIIKGARRGCFLPQVAVEAGWDTVTFLDHCCAHKAGLPPGAWKDDPEVEVFLFTAEVFGD